MKEYPNLVIKIGTNWFLDIEVYNLCYEGGIVKKKLGPYPNEASARLAELAFLKAIENEL
jgi:hypothetical protein